MKHFFKSKGKFIRPDLPPGIKPTKCPYCLNTFIGRNYDHTKELIQRHVTKVHADRKDHF